MYVCVLEEGFENHGHLEVTMHAGGGGRHCFCYPEKFSEFFCIPGRVVFLRMILTVVHEVDGLFQASASGLEQIFALPSVVSLPISAVSPWYVPSALRSLSACNGHRQCTMVSQKRQCRNTHEGR